MKIRETTDPAELVPTVLMEGNPTKEFITDFMMVQLGNGAPTTKDFNILRVYDFPWPAR